MFAFDRLFDFNGDGHLDLFERAIQFQVIDRTGCDGSTENRVSSGFVGYTDNDDIDVFADAGLDYDELEFMDPAKRRGVLEEAGLDPDKYDF